LIHSPRLPKSLPVDTAGSIGDHVHIFQSALTGLEANNLQASGLILEQVKARKVQLLRSNLPGLRVVDSVFENCEISASEWEKAFFRRVVFKDCRLMGAQMLEGIFEDVEFINCQAESLTVVSARFKNCRFAKSVLRKSSFDGADASNVIFDNCDLSEANFHLARLTGADFRTSEINGLCVGVQEMQGAIIAPHQALQVVGLLGVEVKVIDQPEAESDFL
jgi:uncharacterized protein YjbI with pentapeptide repeats